MISQSIFYTVLSKRVKYQYKYKHHRGAAMVVIVCLLNLQLPMQSVPLMLWVRIPLRRGVLDTILYGKVCQW